MSGVVLSGQVLSGGQSQKVAMSTVSAQSTAIADASLNPAVLAGNPIPVTITVDATCFVRKGAAPTALSDGTDQVILANSVYKTLAMIGDKFAFIMASGTGNAYITTGI